jgi:hypothetical protein
MQFGTTTARYNRESSGRPSKCRFLSWSAEPVNNVLMGILLGQRRSRARKKHRLLQAADATLLQLIIGAV